MTKPTCTQSLFFLTLQWNCQTSSLRQRPDIQRARGRRMIMSWPLARTFGRRFSPLLLSGSFLYLLRSGARASGLGETRRFFLSVFLRFSFFSALHFSGLGREGAASSPHAFRSRRALVRCAFCCASSHGIPWL